MASLGASLLGRSGLRRVPLSFGAQELAANLPDADPAPGIVDRVADHFADVPEPAAISIPEVVLQAQRLARAIAGEVPLPAPLASSEPAEAARRRVAFTLRLDGKRHRCLRLTVCSEGRSAQQILITALDRYLAAAQAAISTDPVRATIPAAVNAATQPSLRRTPTGSKP
jgi:hypothetical protein